MIRPSWLLALFTLFLALPAQAAFTDNGDGTVTDTVTGLMWDKCSWGQSNNTTCADTAATTHTWTQALGVAVTANAMNGGVGYKSHNDWRLPNKNELESLVKIDASSPAIDTAAFPNTVWDRYWTSTNYAPGPANAWFVRFSIGDSNANDKSSNYYVRLVRSGQLFDSFDFQQVAIAYSATTFTEAAANDGSTSTSVTLTLSNDTYVADVVSASRITASNVPAGLTANFVRTSDTVITATLTGNATAHANADDISNLTFTFANGAFTNTATAANVTNYTKNNLVVDFADPVAVAYSATTFTEAAANDGSTSTSVTLTLSNDTYVADVVSASRITASNVPAGLTANFVRTSDTVITATLTGNATTHANANDIANLTFTFANGAFTNTATAANVTNYAKNNLVVDFADPVAVAYSATTFTEAAANDGSTSTSVTLTLSNDTYVADVVSANRVTASNVPAGLTANFVRTSDTVITATLTGNATAHANANDISNLTFTFADGAFTTTATAANVSNYAKNNLVVDFADPADTTPDAFSFTAQTGGALSTLTTSNTITVAGINSAANISIAGGTYKIGSGSYTAAAGTVNNGDTVTLQQTSSGSYSTLTTATLTIGGVDGAFNVTTVAAPVVASPVNGVCGTANGVAASSAPSANRCATGPSSAVAGSGPWTWSCYGSDGGSNASCSAPLALLDQTISFGAAPSITVGGSGTASATATSGLAVSFSSTTTGVCTVSGSTVTGVSAGTCTIAADQAGDATYNAAPQVTQNITVGKNSQTISFGAAPTVAVGVTGTASATTTSGLAVSFSSTTTGVCTVSGSTVTGVAAGACTIAANQAGNASYNPAPQATQSITVTLALVNGACGSTNGVATAFVPSANLCATGSASAVTTGSPWTWTCNGSGGGTNASCSAPNQSIGSGSDGSDGSGGSGGSDGSGGRAVVSGDSWVVDLAQSSGFIPTNGHAKSPPIVPPGFIFPHGLFDFTLITGAAGSAGTITITYPEALPAGVVYWKYGPSPDGYNCSGAACAAAHWYQMPPAQAVFAGDTVTLTIVDGGVGDDDLAANSVIVDQGGPGLPVSTASIPTLSEWGLLALVGLLGLFGMGALRRRAVL